MFKSESRKSFISTQSVSLSDFSVHPCEELSHTNLVIKTSVLVAKCILARLRSKPAEATEERILEL